MTSANRNLSSGMVEDSRQPFAEGAFRVVTMGHYTNGCRKDQTCVCKRFKTGSVFGETFFELDILAVEKAQEIIDAFNDADLVPSYIRLNHPDVWPMPNGERVLVEPFIRDFTKYNSNTGVVFGNSYWDRVMQALSHFSYHKTGGQHVLCDLQGGVTRRGMLLTDPVILSRRRTYGVTDLGPEGISTFFGRHHCNEFCQSHWQTPRDRTIHFGVVRGTSMVAWNHRECGRYGGGGLGAIEEDEDEDEDDDMDYDDDSSSSNDDYGYMPSYTYYRS